MCVCVGSVGSCLELESLEFHLAALAERYPRAISLKKKKLALLQATGILDLST